MVRLDFNNHYRDVSTMHTGNIDTLEIPYPFTETNIFMNSNLLSCVDKRVTYFCSNGDLLPNLSQTLY